MAGEGVGPGRGRDGGTGQGLGMGGRPRGPLASAGPADGPSRRGAYIAIDLKSFYASVECRERGLDPLSTNLVVADVSRTEKTICLAVSPSLKAYGIAGRPRLFQVVERVREVNAARRAALGGRPPSGSSWDDLALRRDPSLMLDYIAAKPRMQLYMDVSAAIYQIYLRYASAEDIHVYSIDEVFIDAAPYLRALKATPAEMARAMARDVLRETGITATAGVGTNLYLAKVAMDIVAKHIQPDESGARVAELDEASYRRRLWTHRPLTDFWRVGPGIARRLEANGMRTMGDVARRSLEDEDGLYALLGVNAEYLIDHAWGAEPATIADIHAYRPASKSLSQGQVLPCAYGHDRARVVVREMAEALSLDLVEKGLAARRVQLWAGYEKAGRDGGGAGAGAGLTGQPDHAQGTRDFARPTSSTRLICEAALAVFDERADPSRPVRRLYVVAADVAPYRREGPGEAGAGGGGPVPGEQLTLFDADATGGPGGPDCEDGAAAGEGRRGPERERARLEREHDMQESVLDIKRRFGKNAILRGTDLLDGARARERNQQIGGHSA